MRMKKKQKINLHSEVCIAIHHFPTSHLLSLKLFLIFISESEADSGSVGSAGSGTSPSAPPPSFAPPKPIGLVPQQIVIMQPTPEVESRGTFGEEIDAVELEGDVSADDGIGDENSDMDNNAEGPTGPPPAGPPPNADFSLEKPNRQPTGN